MHHISIGPCWAWDLLTESLYFIANGVNGISFNDIIVPYRLGSRSKAALWPLNVMPCPVICLRVCCVYSSSSSKWWRKLFCSLLPDVMGWTSPVIHASFRKDANCARIHASHQTFCPSHTTGATGVFRRLQRKCLNPISPCLQCWT